jgi:hypothetical protein
MDENIYFELVKLDQENKVTCSNCTNDSEYVLKTPRYGLGFCSSCVPPKGKICEYICVGCTRFSRDIKNGVCSTCCYDREHNFDKFKKSLFDLCKTNKKVVPKRKLRRMTEVDSLKRWTIKERKVQRKLNF